MAAVRAFADVGAEQVRNLPQQIRTLVIPFGSGNSATGILTGLQTFDRTAVSVKLIGIGPPRLPWVLERLAGIGIQVPADLELHDLHGTGYARYSDLMPETRDGIRFHPTYEGKVIRYLDEKVPSWWRRDGSVCFWIIGAALHPERN